MRIGELLIPKRPRVGSGANPELLGVGLKEPDPWVLRSSGDVCPRRAAYLSAGFAGGSLGGRPLYHASSQVYAVVRAGGVPRGVEVVVVPVRYELVEPGVLVWNDVEIGSGWDVFVVEPVPRFEQLPGPLDYLQCARTTLRDICGKRRIGVDNPITLAPRPLV